ncbi:MAG: reverse transcriptase family protein, partial [Pseudomonadota bacterium]
PRPYPPGPAAMVSELLQMRAVRRLYRNCRRTARWPAWDLSPAYAEVLPALADLALPTIPTPAALAGWLGLTLGELDWFADPQSRLARPSTRATRHYRCRWQEKRSGAPRLIEAPLPRLKTIQREINSAVLAEVPPHAAAFAFTPGRDCRAGAAMHAGEDVVITLDLQDFFTTVSASRVHAIFRCLGYTHPVARLLTGLTTVVTPSDVLASCDHPLPFQHRQRLRVPHLPQGAPTSPALANLAAFGLDRRFSALASRLGARYSRYADDLAFSGPRTAFPSGAASFIRLARAIVEDEGFLLNNRKTRVMGRHCRQSVTGLTVNAGINTARKDYDTLKAILTNCRRHGPATQNRAAHPAFRQHLEGRVAWHASVNPHRGRRLAALLDAIDWSG